MEAIKIKLKIGQHEFEAEGPAEIVQSQFQAFKELIATVPMQKNDTPATNPTQEKTAESSNQQGQSATNGTLILDKIMRLDGRIVSLTAQAGSDENAILLVMLGQRNYRGNEAVTGSEIMDGLQQSGIRIARVDRLMDKLAGESLVIRIGAHRATRYRFTNQGLTRAQEIAKAAIASVA